jgi:UDP-glucose 4-epimerase
VAALVEAGYDVQAVVRPGTCHIDRLPEDDEHIWYVPLKMEQYDLAKRYIGRAEVWFHFAWDATTPQGRADEDKQAENVRHSLELLNAAAELGAKRFVFAGSQAEYGVHQSSITEETPCMPLSEYGKAKLAFGTAAARICQRQGIEFTYLRIFSVYGPEETEQNLVSSCIRTFLTGEDMPLSAATQTWNYLHIKDFASLMALIARAEHGAGIYNVAGTDTRALKAFIEEIHTLCGGGRCLYGAPADRPEGAVSLNPDIGKAMDTFSWQPAVSFEQGILEMVEKNKP